VARPVPTLVALEYVTDDDGPMLELLCDHLGFEVVERHPHPALDAEMTLVDAGVVMITVLCRTAVGDRPQIPPTSCALSQLVFDVDDGGSDGDVAPPGEPGAPGEPGSTPQGADGFTGLIDRLVEAGAPVLLDGEDMFHLGAQLTTSVFGSAPTLVFHRRA
jgi:hypothetical protein